MTKKDETPKKVEVVLLADHTHEGKPRKKGDNIQVTERQRAFLAERKKIAAGDKPVATGK
jgi:hypothetical protein